MGIIILEGELRVGQTAAVMISKPSMVAFGPVFDNTQQVDLFIRWHDDEHPGCVDGATARQLRERFESFLRKAQTCDECDEWMIAFTVRKDKFLCDSCAGVNNL